MTVQDAPRQFYGSDRFGLWQHDDLRVKYHCEMALWRLQSHVDSKKTQSHRPGRSYDTLLKELLEWDIDRCLCDDASWDDGKKSLSHQWHSEAARAEVERDGPSKVVFEHSIPRVVVVRGMVDRFRSEKWEKWEQVRDYLRPRRAIALITKEEDGRLCLAGLQSRMPAGWDDQVEKNIDAGARYRYQSVGIRLCPPLPRSANRDLSRRVALGNNGNWSRGQKLQIVTELFDDAPPTDYIRVGGVEDRELLDEESGTSERTDCVALEAWLPCLRSARPRSTRTDGFETGLPVCVGLEGDDESLTLYLHRGYIDDAHMRQALSQALPKELSVGSGAGPSSKRLCKLPLLKDGPAATLKVALEGQRERLNSVTVALRRAGLLPE